MNEPFSCINSLNETSAIDYIRESARTYITKNFVLGADETLENDVSLLDSGIIDSTSVLELVEFIESTFKIKIDDRDLDHENFDTVDRISKFIASKIEQQPSA